MAVSLTKRQEAVLLFIQEEIERTGLPPTFQEIADHFGFASRRAAFEHLQALERKGYVRKHPGRHRSLEITGKLKKQKGLPLVGRVAAGEPVLAVENIEERVTLEEFFGNREGLFLLKVTGESMVDAGIRDGDYVVVKEQPTVENGEVAVVLLDDEATVKKVFFEKNRIRLQPENKSMKPTYIKKGDERIRICGRVAGVLKRL